MLRRPSRREASFARPPAVLVLPPGMALAFSGGRGMEGVEVIGAGGGVEGEEGGGWGVDVDGRGAEGGRKVS